MFSVELRKIATIKVPINTALLLRHTLNPMYSNSELINSITFTENSTCHETLFCYTV